MPVLPAGEAVEVGAAMTETMLPPTPLPPCCGYVLRRAERCLLEQGHDGVHGGSSLDPTGHTILVCHTCGTRFAYGPIPSDPGCCQKPEVHIHDTAYPCPLCAGGVPSERRPCVYASPSLASLLGPDADGAAQRKIAESIAAARASDEVLLGAALTEGFAMAQRRIVVRLRARAAKHTNDRLMSMARADEDAADEIEKMGLDGDPEAAAFARSARRLEDQLKAAETTRSSLARRIEELYAVACPACRVRFEGGIGDGAALDVSR
jgi:hypothetical protein